MRRQHLLAGGVMGIMALVVALGWAQGPGGPPPGGGRGGRPGGMEAMTYLEKAWTAVSFQLNCTAEQQEQLKPTFASALETRDQALTQAKQNRDMEAMQKAAETCKATLTAKLKAVLSADQLQTLDKLTQPTMGPPPG